MTNEHFNIRNTRPVSSAGLTADDLLRKAMQTPPPADDPHPPKKRVSSTASAGKAKGKKKPGRASKK
jgi:hypothetical protein